MLWFRRIMPTLCALFLTKPVFAITADYAFTLHCHDTERGNCTFLAFAEWINLKDNVGEVFELYLEDRLAYRGTIEQVTIFNRSNDLMMELKAEGVWWLKPKVAAQVVADRTHLYFSPLAAKNRSQTSPGVSQDPTDRMADALALRNDKDEPVLSVFGKMGSPLSPSSRNGFGIEYAFKQYCPVEIATGTYASRQNAFSNEPQKSLRNIALSGGLLLGTPGSQLKVGGAFVHSRVNLTGVDTDGEGFAKTREFVGFVPTVGVRFTSDSYYLFTVDFGKYMNVKSDLKNFVGNTPTSSTLLDNSKELTVIGLGFGI